ncbi:isochorismate synthase DhbC [Bacillus pumilus]|uniref:isochorismate synthase DhbC n=1 Tax=Bacillus pumilus TaxID=1408 RepID=UPI0024C1D1E3|nr:isochorismate synthase DhbC [Bacillus pumilus]WHX44922.1 isochorismate synthase DhbC [Bacillus pumilus]
MKHSLLSSEEKLQLIQDYQPGAFFLASPKRTILAEGIFQHIETNQLNELSTRVAHVFDAAKQAGIQAPIVAGAVPFDPAQPVRLNVPIHVQFSDPLEFHQGDESEVTSPSYEVSPVPSPEVYMNGVNEGLAKIEKGELSKIVISRSLHLKSNQDIHTKAILERLARHNTTGYTFAANVADPKSPQKRTLLGASPELLLSKTGSSVISNPLAGSRPRSSDPVEDQRRHDELLTSAKDLHEHAVVVDAVTKALAPYCRKLDVPASPSVIQTETMWHLSTVVKGELADSSVSSIDLALSLHPTPAVCGTPTADAREAIQAIEPFDRGFFTGMIGWADANGDGDWIVTIRCAEAEGQSLRLFAGAGVVKGSKAEEELAETSAKFNTMLRAMGIHQL